MANDEIKGGCFCGAVELRVTGEPSAMGYCHCKDCAAWSATPINSYSFWRPDQIGNYKRLRKYSNVLQDRSQQEKVLQEMRWPYYDRASKLKLSRYFCSDIGRLFV